MKRSFQLSIMVWLAIWLHVCVAVAFAQSAPEAMSDRAEARPYVSGITPGRARSLVAVVLAVTSVVMSWRSFKRLAARGAGTARTLGFTALVFGALAVILGIVHLVGSAGGFGTGGGKAGAIVAMVLGACGIGASGVVLRRTLAKE